MLAQIDLGLQAQPGAHRLLDAFRVDHRQHAGHAGIDEADLAVGLGAEFGRGAGEQLGFGQDLGMDFHADDDFPVAGLALDQFGCGSRSCRPPPVGGLVREIGGLLRSPGRRAAPCASSKALPISCRPSGRPFAVKPGRHRKARQTRQIHRHGEDVVQIHGDRIGGLLAHARRPGPAWRA